MGMRQAEIRAKFDQIVDFAGLHRFVDTPVKRFSSGMYVRLGFAVAAHLNPEVLLVDEVLAVGDADFRSRCLQRIEELRSRGMTIVFVSHDMAEIERLCNRAIFLSQGQIRAEGDPRQVIAEYYETVMAGALPTLLPQANDLDRPTNGNGALPAAEILNLRFLNQAGEPVEAIPTGAPFAARIDYVARRPIEDPVFELLFHAPDGRLHCQYSTALTDDPIPRLEGLGSVEIASDALGLTPGLFAIDAALTRRGALSPYDRKRRAWFLKVLPGKPVRGLFYAPQRWRLLPPAEVGPPP
jgi:hypothetical protein